MAVLKIRKVTEEKEGYGSMLIRTAVVCAVLLSVCSAYFSVINLKLNMAAIVPAVVIPVFLAALFLSAKRGRKIKALLLLLAASAVFILGIRPSMNGMLPFWNGYVKAVNAYYRISWTPLSGEVDPMGSQMVIAAVSMALAVLLFLILSSRRAGSAAASVMVLPVVMAALVGIFPSWNCCWALLISGCFYRIIFQRGKPETLFRTCMCGAVVLAVLYGCGRMAAPKINSYRETHTESYKKIKNVLLDAQNMDMHEMPKTEKGANYAAGGIGKGDLDGLGEHRPQGRKDLEITVTEKPDRSIYLRAYTGTTYTGKGWKELSASAFSEVAPRVGGGEKKKELFELPFTQIAEDPQSPAPQTMKVELVGASKEFAYSPYYMQVPSGGKVILDSRLKAERKGGSICIIRKRRQKIFREKQIRADYGQHIRNL